MNTLANNILNNFKKNGWIKTSSDQLSCYEQDGKNNDVINDIIYKSEPRSIYEGTAGEYVFIFDDKSAIIFDGRIFEFANQYRAETVLSCEGHGWKKI